MEDYNSWIDRERRVRVRILKTSPLTKDSSYRVCLDCDEVCLCHEEVCPNCGSTKTEFQKVAGSLLEAMINCKKRFAMLNEVKEG